MTRHIHRLEGCTPTPLARYLKALAVLRLVGEQKDRRARGFFRDDVFHLASELDERSLVRFFVDEYEPTPLVTPWNGGSGFYPKDSKAGIDAILASTGPRFAEYRRTLDCVRAMVDGRKAAPKEEEKWRLLAQCRAAFEGASLEWINAAVALASDAGGRTGYPALLGTGGNDGRLDFANNFMQRVSALVLNGRASLTIEHALFARPTSGLDSGAIGQFFPGAAGGANASADFAGESLFDPWDFVLMLEGAVVLAVAAVRRLDATTPAQLAGAFTLRASAAGHGSAAASEEDGRGEQWMPIWSAPATIAEVRALFAAGRLRCGASDATRPIEAARAIARLGVARGIQAFERYGYLERNGRSNFAVPLGRWVVRAQPNVELLDEIAPWLDRLRDAKNRDGAPAALERQVRAIEDAMFAVCRNGRSTMHWERLLAALGDAEEGMLARSRATRELRLRPLPRLSARWFDAIDDRSAEVRIAAAIASQRTDSATAGGFRSHLLPLHDGTAGASFATTADDLVRDPRVVWSGRDLLSDLAAVALRRVVDGASEGSIRFSLRGALHADAQDVDAFVAGAVADERIARLIRPLAAVDLTRGHSSHSRASSNRILPALALFQVLYAHQPSADAAERSVRPDAAVLRRLAAGDLAGAADLALHRLRAMGLRPRVRRVHGAAILARRIAASLLIPIGAADVRRALETISKPIEDVADAT